MPAVLLDTHAWVWSLTDDPRLSTAARDAIGAATSVLVSPISFFEIGHKVRIGKWPEMAMHIADLPSLLERQGGSAAALTPEICLGAALLDWPHRDPFDRIIAATGIALPGMLVSADTVFGALASQGLRRVW